MNSVALVNDFALLGEVVVLDAHAEGGGPGRLAVLLEGHGGAQGPQVGAQVLLGGLQESQLHIFFGTCILAFPK